MLNTLTVEAEATHIPESVTVSIAGLEAGASIHAKEPSAAQGHHAGDRRGRGRPGAALSAQAEEPSEGEAAGDEAAEA